MTKMIMKIEEEIKPKKCNTSKKTMAPEYAKKHKRHHNRHPIATSSCRNQEMEGYQYEGKIEWY